MSGYTQTTNELLYAYGGASTNLATFTTEDNLLKTYPPCAIPGTFFANTGSRSSSLKIRAVGQAGATATPTFTFTIRLISGGNVAWSAGGLVLGTSTACAAVSGVTLGVWQLDLDVVLRTLAAGGSNTTTVVAGGTITGSAFSSANNTIPAAGTAPTLATIDVSATYSLFLSAACSASSASNLINTQLLKVYGEN